MKKIIALLLVLVMVLTCFVACAKDEKDDEEKEEKQTTTEELKENDKDSEEEKTTDSEDEETTASEEENTTASSTNGKSLDGTYSCTLDADSDLIASLGEDAVAAFQLGLSLEITYVFHDDMTCEASMVINGEDELLANIIVYSVNATAEQAGMSMEEYWSSLIESYGSEEALMAAMEEELAPTIEELLETFKGMEASASGTYEIDGDKLFATMDGETDEFTITDSGLLIEYGGVTTTLERR